MMKMKIVDGRKEFTGHKITCPMCGHWMLRAYKRPFRKITVLDGQLACVKCGTVVTFGANAKAEFDDGK